jgi:hypothetical protein
MSGRISVTIEVDREVWFKFRTLAQSGGISLNRAAEGVLRETLKSAGIEVRSEESAAKVERPMVRR